MVQVCAYLLGGRLLHVALWRRLGLHNRLGWRRWGRRRVGVPAAGLVAGRRGHGLAPGGGHDVAGLGLGVLGEDGGRSLVHGLGIGVLAGPLAAQGHLAKLRGQLITLADR